MGTAGADGYLQFADSEVSRLCAVNFGDGVGTTIAQVQAVTNIGNVFAENGKITEFTELKYFESITELPYHAFYKCVNLATVEFPPYLQSIGQEAFDYYEVHTLSSDLILPNLVTIGYAAFPHCASKLFYAPKCTTIGDWAFYNCQQMEAMVFGATVPSLGDNSLRSLNSTCLFYVPAGALDNYLSSWWWLSTDRIKTYDDLPDKYKVL